jgi:hypothetical protein
VKIGGLIHVFRCICCSFCVFVVAGCIVYVLAVVASFIVVFVLCLCSVCA